MAFGILAGLLVLLFALFACDVGCGYVRPLPPAARPLPTQLDYALRVETFCLTADPFIAKSVIAKGGLGSAVMIDSRHALTAYHVIECAYLPDLHVVLPDGKRLHVVVDRVWPERDIVRLAIAPSHGGVHYFGKIKPPQIAQAVVDGVACAASMHPKQEGSCGRVSAVADELKRHGPVVGDLDMSISVHPGNSGSGIYDGDGALIGLVTGGTFNELGEALGTGIGTSLWPIREELFR